jgi:hypothetical protein
MNNNDYQPTYDPAFATLNWPWLERHGLNDIDDFDRYVTSPGVVPTANDPVNVVTPAVPPAAWNFYGDNSCGFVQQNEPVIEWPAKFSKPRGDMTVTGYSNDVGKRITGGDPWIGLPVVVNAGVDPAKLVDVDPVCPWSSQIFVDSFGLGSPAGAAGFTAESAGRAHARWVWLERNLNQSKDVIIAGVGSAMWQLGLPTDGLAFRDPAPAPGSLAAQLQTALARPEVQGLMVRFVTYHTMYFQGSAFTVRDKPDWKAIVQLYAEYAAALAKYERGDLDARPPRPVNRAYSNTVGWIAPWTTTEMRTAPGGRVLHSERPVKPLSTPPTPVPIGPAVLEYTVDAADPTRVGSVAIDLGSTIPELGSALDKVDFGTMQLALDAGDGTSPKPFADIQHRGGYDKAAYERTAGVVEIPASRFLTPVTVAELDQRLAVLFVDPASGSSQVGLRETEYIAETDDRGVYVNEPGEPWSPPDPEISVEVRYRGGKPPTGTQLRIAQYSPNPPGFGEGGWQLVSATADKSQTPFVTMEAGGTVVDGAYVTVVVPQTADELPYSTVTIRLTAIRPGPPVLQFSPLPPADPETPPPGAVAFPAVAQQSFANVRALPFHNAMATAFENWLRGGPSVDLVTQRVFDSVFRTFFLMYPAMRFLRDPLQFQAWRSRVCRATDPAAFETAAYMPVTRSLSAGQRRMLELWKTYVDGDLPTPVTGAPFVRRS